MRIFNYIKVAIRSLFRYRSDAAINVIGLSIGITISIIVLMYVRYELNYDKSFNHSEQTYRVITNGIVGNKTFNSALAPMPLSDYLKQNYPEVNVSAKILRGANKLISYKEKKYNEDNFFYADSSFFEIFNTPFILGDPQHALNGDDHVVITKRIAQKYFGFENPLGKKIKLDNGLILEVTGICEPLPRNSHFHFDFVASQKATEQLFKSKSKKHLEEYKNNWLRIDWYTYVILNKNSDPASFAEKIKADLKDEIDQQIRAITTDSIDAADGIKGISLQLQPLEDIHLHSRIDDELEPNSKKIYVTLFLFIAIFVLTITSVNFINLTTAKASYRLHEISIRKLAGVTRQELIRQFIIEAITYSFIALFIGLVSVELLLPSFNKLFGLHLKFNNLDSRFDLIYIIILTFFIGIISGIYPAIAFSRFKEVNIFRKDYRLGKKGFMIRGMLSAVQITVATFLVILAIGMYWQLSYLKNKNLGFNSDNILVVERGYSLGRQFQEFKAKIKSFPHIEEVSACSVLPGDKATQTSFNYSGKNGDQMILLPVNFVERDFFKTLGIKFYAGELWNQTDKKMASDVVINEAAQSYLKMSKPLGQKISFPQSNKEKHWGFSIRGVVKDFYFEPLQFPLRPLVLMDLPKGSFYDHLLIKVSDDIDAELITEEVSNIWKDYTNNEPFEYKLLNDKLKNNLSEETKVLKIVLVFMVLSLFVAWIGLRALAAYTEEQKHNDLEIRKLSGATPKQIFTELFSYLSHFILIGIIVAIPVSYMVIQIWLNGFANHDRLPVTIMIAIGSIIWGLSFLMVLLHSLKSIKSTPETNHL
ncbi:FtsX-like permease family protein [Labilibacter sediminis]|nr:FtsX-like permease family protein [Labilibacter sediminis]